MLKRRPLMFSKPPDGALCRYFFLNFLFVKFSTSARCLLRGTQCTKPDSWEHFKCLWLCVFEQRVKNNESKSKGTHQCMFLVQIIEGRGWKSERKSHYSVTLNNIIMRFLHFRYLIHVVQRHNHRSNLGGPCRLCQCIRAELQAPSSKALQWISPPSVDKKGRLVWSDLLQLCR